MAESLQAQIPESNGATEAYRRSGRVYMLVLLFAAAVLNATDRGIFAIAMPAIKHEYSFTDSQLGLLGGVAFGVFYALLPGEHAASQKLAVKDSPRPREKRHSEIGARASVPGKTRSTS